MATPLPPNEAPFTASHALVIGASAYRHGIPSLRTPRADAIALRALLQREHGFQVESLTWCVTAARLRAALFRLTGRVRRGDRALFYFAGHGHAYAGEDRPSGFLVPEDARARVLDTYVAMSEVYRTLDDLPCKHVLAILDCCFAGAFRWAGTRDLDAPPRVLYHERYRRYVTSGARQLLVSADHDERALDSLEFGRRDPDGHGAHSPFAEALLAGLRGQADAGFAGAPPDGVITSSELVLYLRNTVERRLEEHGITQTPRLFGMRGHDRGEYVFLLPSFQGLAPAPGLDDEHNPYRGLAPFTERHSHLLFGRNRVIDALENKTSGAPLVVVTGPSGSGKSSVVLAGLTPRLKARSRSVVVAPFRPLTDPLGSMAVALRDALVPIRDDHIAEDIMAWLRADADRRLVIVVDQLEETLAIGQERNRGAFLAVLSGLLVARDPGLRVIVVVRADEEPSFKRCGLAPWWTDGRYVVPAMSGQELRQVIERPAAEAALELELRDDEPGLADRLFQAVFDTPGALPLLSFTLSELYRAAQARYLEGDTSRVLRIADLDQLRGVSGVLERRADELYDRLGSADRRSLERLMVRMVATDRGVTRRRAVADSELEFDREGGSGSADSMAAAPIDETSRMKRLKRELVNARLAVIDMEVADPTIEPAHDALVRGWSRLREWIADEAFAVQRRVTLATEEWEADRRRRRSLWDRDDPLDKAVKQLAVPGWYNLREVEFLRRSLAKANWFRRLVVLVIAALAALSLFLVVALGQTSRAQQASEARALAAEAALDPADGDPRHMISSTLMAVESLRNLPAPGASQAVRRSLQLLRVLHPVYGGGWLDVAVSADDTWAAMIGRDHRVRLLRIADGASHGLDIAVQARALAFGPERAWLAVADQAGTLHRYAGYEHSSPVEIAAPIETGAAIRRLQVGGNGRWFIVKSELDTVTEARLWEIASGREVTYFKAGARRKIGDILISGDGRWLVAVDAVAPAMNDEPVDQDRWLKLSPGGRITLWETSAEQARSPLLCDGREVQDLQAPVAFSPDGRWLMARTLRASPVLPSWGDGRLTTWQWTPSAWTSLWRLLPFDLARGHFGAWQESLLASQDSIPFPMRAAFVTPGIGTDKLRAVFGGLLGDVTIWEPTAGSGSCGSAASSSLHLERAAAAAALHAVTAIAADPIGDRVALGYEGGYVQIRDLHANQEESRVFTHDESIEELGFAPGAVITRSSSGVSFWADSLGDTEISRFPALDLRAIVFLDEDRLVASTRDRIAVYSRQSGATLGDSLAVTGSLLRWNRQRGQLVIADISTQHPSATVWRCQVASAVTCASSLTFSPRADRRAPELRIDDEGQIAAFMIRGKPPHIAVELVDLTQPASVPTRVEIDTHGGHGEVVEYSIAPGALAFVYSDGSVELVGRDGKVTDTIRGIPGELSANAKLHLSSNGRRLAVANPKGTLDLYDIRDGKLQLATSSLSSGDVNDMVFDADASRIAASGGGRDGSHVQVWDTADGTLQVATGASGGSALQVAFSPSSRWLGILRDGTLSITPLQPADLIELACSRIPAWGALDPQDWRRLSARALPQPCPR